MLGSDYTDVSTGTELSFNARVAANLGSPVVLAVHGRDRTPEQVATAAASALIELRANHANPVAIIANRVDAAHVAGVVVAQETVELGQGQRIVLGTVGIDQIDALLGVQVAHRQGTWGLRSARRHCPHGQAGQANQGGGAQELSALAAGIIGLVHSAGDLG